MTTRKRTIAVAIVATVALAALHIFCGLFTQYSFVTAAFDIVCGKPKVLLYGLPYRNEAQAAGIAAEYGFEQRAVAGCIVTLTGKAGYDSYNYVTGLYLKQKLGSNWEEKFELRVDSLFREEQVDSIRARVMVQDDVHSLQVYLDTAFGGTRKIEVRIFPQQKEGANVLVGEQINDSTFRVYSYYHADPYSLEISSFKY